MIRRVALFGGTGFVGGYLVDALLANGYELSLLARAGSEHKVRQLARCRVVTGDVGSVAAIDDALEGCDAVIYCIGILREFPKAGITFEALQYDAVVRIAHAAKSKCIRRFLLMSANGVKLPGTAYQETKFRAERYLQDNGFDVTVFRPSVIFGDPSGAMEIATQMCRDMVAQPFPAIGFFTGWRPGRGEVAMSPVHAEDVACAFVHALEKPSSVGATYALGGDEALSWPEMIRRVARSVKKDKWIVPMPVAFMRLAAMLFDWLPIFPVTRDQLTMLAEGNTADPDVLRALIGRPPKTFVPENLAYLQDRN